MTTRSFYAADETVAPQRATSPGSLSGALRERTQAIHARAERSGIIKDVLRGKASRYGYALLLRNLLPAYQELEARLERRRQTPGVWAFARRELYRARALEADLQALYPIEWAGSLELLPAGEMYRVWVAGAAEGDSTRLIGHAYARYFGDLSGGPILKRVLTRTLSLGQQELSFYDFPDIPDAEVFKQDCRDALDQAVSEITDIEGVVVGAISAFELNIAVSEAVQEATRG
jgi:heme oxygenase (biliverdin-producing, ferredoxin)